MNRKLEEVRENRRVEFLEAWRVIVGQVDDKSLTGRNSFEEECVCMCRCGKAG